MDVTKEVAGTLRAEANHPPCVLSVENHPADGRITVSEDGRTQTLTSRMGTGGGNVPLVMEKPKTLKIRSGCEGGGKGALVQDDKSATLSCNNDQTVFVSRTYDTAVYSSNKTSFFTKAEEDMAGILTASDYKDPPVVAYGIGRDAFNQGKNAKYKPAIEEELQPTLTAKGPGAVKSGYAVRRLTPTECARLQGFPDWWCENLGTDNPDPSEIKFWEEVWETHRRLVSHNTKAKTEKQIRKWLKNPRSDAAEYKMWGNGVALPCVTFVLSGIVSSDDNSKE